MRNESLRRTINLVVCYGAWLGSIGLAFWSVLTMSAVEAASHRWVGLTVIILMGIGITAALIRSRYKLSDTITEVYRAGVRSGTYKTLSGDQGEWVEHPPKQEEEPRRQA